MSQQDFLSYVLQMNLIGIYGILVVLVVRFLLKKVGSRFAYYLWMIAFINLLIPVTFSGSFSLIPRQIYEISVWEKDGMQSGMADAKPSQNQSVEHTGDGTNSGTEWSDVGNSAGNGMVIDNAWNNIQNGTDNGANTGAGWNDGGDGTGKGMDLGNTNNAFVTTLLTVWGLGAAVLLITELVGLFQVKKMLAKAECVEHDKERRVRTMKGIGAPFLFGFLKPVIYLPDNLENEEREYILCHEMYHRKRKDYLVKTIALLIHVFYWYNPFVWLAFYFLCVDMELSCDEAVLAGGDAKARKVYASSLLKYSAMQNHYILTSLTFGEPSVKTRVKNVLRFKKKGLVITGVAVLCIVLLGLGLFLRPGAEQATNTDSEKEEQTNPNQHDGSEKSDGTQVDDTGTDDDKTTEDSNAGNTVDNGLTPFWVEEKLIAYQGDGYLAGSDYAYDANDWVYTLDGIKLDGKMQEKLKDFEIDFKEYDSTPEPMKTYGLNNLFYFKEKNQLVFLFHDAYHNEITQEEIDHYKIQGPVLMLVVLDLETLKYDMVPYYSSERTAWYMHDYGGEEFYWSDESFRLGNYVFAGTGIPWRIPLAINLDTYEFELTTNVSRKMMTVCERMQEQETVPQNASVIYYYPVHIKGDVVTYEGVVKLEEDTEVLEKITFSMSMGEAVSQNLIDYQQNVAVSVVVDKNINEENGFVLSISDVKFDGVSVEGCKGMQIELSSYCKEAKNQQYTSTEAFYHSEKNLVYLLVSNNTLMMNMMQENEYKMGQGPELMIVAFNPDQPENYEVFPYYLESDKLVSVEYNLPDGRQYHYAESVGIYGMCKGFLVGDFIFTGKSYPDFGILLGFNTNTGEFQLMTEPTRALIALSNEAIENSENNLPANAYMNGYHPVKAEGNYVTFQGEVVTPEEDLSPGFYVYLTVDMGDITKSFPSNGTDYGMGNVPGYAEGPLTMELLTGLVMDKELGNVNYTTFENAVVHKGRTGDAYRVSFELEYLEELFVLDVYYWDGGDVVGTLVLNVPRTKEARQLYDEGERKLTAQEFENFVNNRESLTKYLLDMELPEGYELGEFDATLGYNGGGLIGPNAYEKHGEGVPAYWYYSGFFSLIENGENRLYEWRQDTPEATLVPYPTTGENHTSAEVIELLDDLDKPAYLMRVNHDIFTASEITEEMTEEDYTSDYWYIIFVDKHAGRDYCLALTTKSFTKEEAIAIAKTVRLVPFVGTIE